jgi:hypothetical protein
VQAFAGTATTAAPVLTAPATATSATFTGLTNGTSYTFKVRARNAVAGYGPLSAASNAVTPATVPGAPTIGLVTRGDASAIVRWTPPADDGGSPITGYTVRAHVGTATAVFRTQNHTAAARQVVFNGLTNGTSYTFTVVAANSAGSSAPSARSAAVTPATVPGAPGIGLATSGGLGGAVNATARWTAPASTGGSPITGYRVQAIRIAANGTDGATTQSAIQPATARSLVFTLPAGNYRFTVTAINAVGTSVPSARSAQVTAR